MCSCLKILPEMGRGNIIFEKTQILTQSPKRKITDLSNSW